MATQQPRRGSLDQYTAIELDGSPAAKASEARTGESEDIAQTHSPYLFRCLLRFCCCAIATTYSSSPVGNAALLRQPRISAKTASTTSERLVRSRAGSLPFSALRTSTNGRACAIAVQLSRDSRLHTHRHLLRLLQPVPESRGAGGQATASAAGKGMGWAGAGAVWGVWEAALAVASASASQREWAKKYCCW